MSQQVSVHGPNIGHGGEFHVHRAGCADTKRGEYPFVEQPWTVEATSQQAVVEDIYSDIIPENPGSTWESYADTVRFFPCTDLPTTEPAACTGCGAKVDPLAVFPGGICVDCYAKSPEGTREITADELVAMWGGPVRRSG